MSFEIGCICGRNFNVGKKHLGLRVRCPDCGEPVQVPDKEPAVGIDSYGFRDDRTCPKCGEHWPRDTALCIECGYNFQTGKQQRTEYKLKELTWKFFDGWLGQKRITIHRDGPKETFLEVKSWFLGIPTGTRMVDLEDYDRITTDFEAGHQGSRNSPPMPDVLLAYLEGKGVRTICIYRGVDDDEYHEVINTISRLRKFEIVPRRFH